MPRSTSQGSFETHEKYFDIQYMVSGRRTM
nr:YhcH/YjgK/YiaL family protein [Enterocloster clostridioformis]